MHRFPKQTEQPPIAATSACMNTVKDALLIKEHWPDTEIYVFYIDIRAFGKGFEGPLPSGSTGRRGVRPRHPGRNH